MSINNHYFRYFSLENQHLLIYNIHILLKVIFMSVGTNIKKRRFELKMSQQELADAMGYKTRSTIAKIESGENDVSQKKLVKFAQVLDTTVEALISTFSSSVQHNEALLPKPTNRNKNIAIILAGGKSGRNRQNIPSQFIDVNGKPIIVYCMEVYQSHPLIDDIYIVCLKGWENIVRAYAEQYGMTKVKNIIPAGSNGISSLKNAVDYVNKHYNGDDFLVIQEATRPMVMPEMISKILQSSSKRGSATICHSMNDYVQFKVENKKAKYVDRDSLIALQSPEAHRLSLINEVFLKAKKEQHPLTESCCTMLLYNLGYSINFVEGNVNNIKIVREEDIAAFSAMVRNRN